MKLECGGLWMTNVCFTLNYEKKYCCSFEILHNFIKKNAWGMKVNIFKYFAKNPNFYLNICYIINEKICYSKHDSNFD